MSSSNNRLTHKLLKEMTDDYVHHEMTHQQLSEKYNLSMKTIGKYSARYKFVEKKLKFQNQMIDKWVDRLSTTHSRTLAKVSAIVDKQISRILDVQRKDKDKILDANRMKEVLTAFSLLSKEHRLNTDQPTENNNITIKVEMGGDVPIISENHIINAGMKPDIQVTAEEPQMETPAVEEAIEVVVENQGEDDFIFGDIE